jgi:DNA-binding NtrC family response regulator
MVMASPSSSAAVRSLRVLLVDDENLIRWAVAQTLADAGHTVIEAPDAATALRAVQTSEPFDVALLDYRLPDSNDLSLVRRIRQHAPSSAIVLMTAHGTPQMAEEARLLGVYDVIPKPFDVEVLEQVIVQAHQSKLS